MPTITPSRCSTSIVVSDLQTDYNQSMLKETNSVNADEDLVNYAEDDSGTKPNDVNPTIGLRQQANESPNMSVWKTSNHVDDDGDKQDESHAEKSDKLELPNSGMWVQLYSKSLFLHVCSSTLFVTVLL